MIYNQKRFWLTQLRRCPFSLLVFYRHMDHSHPILLNPDWYEVKQLCSRDELGILKTCRVRMIQSQWSAINDNETWPMKDIWPKRFLYSTACLYLFT